MKYLPILGAALVLAGCAAEPALAPATACIPLPTEEVTVTNPDVQATVVVARRRGHDTPE